MSLLLSNSKTYQGVQEGEFVVPDGVKKVWITGTAPGGGSGPRDLAWNPWVQIAGSLTYSTIATFLENGELVLYTGSSTIARISLPAGTVGKSVSTLSLPAFYSWVQENTMLADGNDVYFLSTTGLALWKYDGASTARVVTNSSLGAVFRQGGEIFTIGIARNTTTIDLYQKIGAGNTFAKTSTNMPDTMGSSYPFSACSQKGGGLFLASRADGKGVVLVDKGVVRYKAFTVGASPVNISGVISMGSRSGAAWGTAGGNSYIFQTHDGGLTWATAYTAQNMGLSHRMSSRNGNAYMIFNTAAAGVIVNGIEAGPEGVWQTTSLTLGRSDFKPYGLESSQSISAGYVLVGSRYWLALYDPAKKALTTTEGLSGNVLASSNPGPGAVALSDAGITFGKAVGTKVAIAYSPMPLILASDVSVVKPGGDSSNSLVIGGGGGSSSKAGGRGGSKQGHAFVWPLPVDPRGSVTRYPGKAGSAATTDTEKGGAGSYYFGPDTETGKPGQGPGSGAVGEEGKGGGGGGESVYRYPLSVSPGDVLIVSVGEPGGPGGAGDGYVTIEWA